MHSGFNSVESFPTHAEAIAVADKDFDQPVSIFVGTGGNVSFIPFNGNDAITRPFATGAVIPVAVKAIRASGTSASDLMAQW